MKHTSRPDYQRGPTKTHGVTTTVTRNTEPTENTENTGPREDQDLKNR